jgi:hypothetical protein
MGGSWSISRFLSSLSLLRASFRIARCTALCFDLSFLASFVCCRRLRSLRELEVDTLQRFVLDVGLDALCFPSSELLLVSVVLAAVLARSCLDSSEINITSNSPVGALPQSPRHIAAAQQALPMGSVRVAGGRARSQARQATWHST